MLRLLWKCIYNEETLEKQTHLCEFYFLARKAAVWKKAQKKFSICLPFYFSRDIFSQFNSICSILYVQVGKCGCLHMCSVNFLSPAQPTLQKNVGCPQSLWCTWEHMVKRKYITNLRQDSICNLQPVHMSVGCLTELSERVKLVQV